MIQKLSFCLAIAIAISSCQLSSKKQQSTETPKQENDSIQIVVRHYSGSSTLVEYEIPILKDSKKKHGIQKRYYRHGNLYSEIPYTNGKRIGTAYTYYPETSGGKPVVWKEQNYIDNQLHGICKRYHEDGTLQAEYEYKNGNAGIGLKEYAKSGKAIKQPYLIVSANRTASGYYVTARLSNNMKKVDYLKGALVEGKYLPKGLKGLQVKNGLGEVMIDASKQSVTITAVFATRYRNKCLVTKTIKLN